MCPLLKRDKPRYINVKLNVILTYSNTKPGDLLLLTLADDVVFEALVVRLAIRHHHHHLAGSRSGTVRRQERLPSEMHTQ